MGRRAPRQKSLNPLQFHVLRLSGTEPAWTSMYNYAPHTALEGKAGTYCCSGCSTPLFDAARKYESGTGWPSFWEPLQGSVSTKQEGGLFSLLSVFVGARTEVSCATCGGHLGHAFGDGPRRDPRDTSRKATGIRYCINGAALDFEGRDNSED